MPDRVDTVFLKAQLARVSNLRCLAACKLGRGSSVQSRLNWWLNA